MWPPEDDGLWIYQRPAFLDKVPIPSSAVCDQPLVCMSINVQWVPLILGALSALVQPSTWDTTDPTALQAVLAQAQDLLDAIGTAVPCNPQPEPCSGGGCTTQACNIAGYIATALIHDVVLRIVQRAQQDQFIINTIAGILSIIPFLGTAVGGLLKALSSLDAAINGPNLSHYEDALGDPTLFGEIACAIYGCIETDGMVTDGNFNCIITAVGSVSYTHSDVITAIALYLGQIGAAGLEAMQLPGAYAVYDCSGCPGGITGAKSVLFPLEDSGRVDITIAAGSAIGQAVVTFRNEFSSLPVITVSCNEQDFIASVDGGSTVGFTATIKAATSLDSPITATVFWIAVQEGWL